MENLTQNVQHDLAKLERAPRDLERWQRAQQQLLSGRGPAALPVYRELTHRYPAILNLWFEFGTAAAADLDFELALNAFGRAEILSAGNPATLVMLGQQFHRLRKIDRARACYERAVQADPSSTHARLSLAAWLERERRIEEAIAQVDASLSRNAKDPSALYYRAFLLQRAGQNAEAEKILRDLIQGGLSDPGIKISSHHLLGVTLDEQGQYAEAMEWLLKAKALVRQHNNVLALEQSYDKAVRNRRGLLAKLAPAMIQRWKEEAARLPGKRPMALLAGHPRSGTTLLEQILDAHPAVRAFDESEAFVSEIADKLAPAPPGALLTAEALNALPNNRREELRRRYFKSLFRELDGELSADRLLLDKNPVATASLHLWLRLFPESKIIIALRDPRDVVLSCFFQNLALTPLNANFLSLDGAVKHYSDTMDVWLRLRELGGFEWVETRYENIVGGTEAEGRRVTEFLGLAWNEAQIASHESARKKLVFSPTYSDVAQPVHGRAVGRWRNYAGMMEAVVPKLDAFARSLGYE